MEKEVNSNEEIGKLVEKIISGIKVGKMIDEIRELRWENLKDGIEISLKKIEICIEYDNELAKEMIKESINNIREFLKVGVL